MHQQVVKAILFIAALLIAAAVAMFILSLLAMSVTAGQWVNIDQFRGMSTNTNGINQDMSIARSVDGWMVRSEGLSKPWFTKYATSPVIASPSYILGHSTSGDAVLMFSSTFYRLKNDTLDNVKVRVSNTPDSARAINGTDSILSLSDHIHTPCVDSTRWLNFALTDRALITWNSQEVDVNNFYSNRWLLSGGALTAQVKLLNYPVSTPSVDEGSGTLDWRDTTAIFDGDYVFLYEAEVDSIRNVNNTTVVDPPVYQAAGSDAANHYYDTLRVLNTIELGSGDSVLAIRVNTDDSLRGGDYTRFWVLMDDTLSTSQCVPCSVLVADTTLPDSVLLTLGCDSTRFGNTNHYWGRVEGSGSPCMYAILYRPGTREDVTPATGIFCDRINTAGAESSAPRAYFNYVERFGRLHYATLEVGSGNLNKAFTGALTAKRARITDCDIFECISTGSDANGNYYLNQDTAQAVCLYYKADTLGWKHWWKFLLFDTDTLKKSQFDSLSVNATAARSDRIQFYNRPRVGGWSVTTTSGTASPYRFGTLHRQRSWVAGWDDTDSLPHIAYSDAIGNIAAGATYDFYEFDAGDAIFFEGPGNVKALSSLGQNLAIYFRNHILIQSGFAAADFYVQPAPVGIGAVSHMTVARDPIHNADVILNENGEFLFSGGGADLLTPTIETIFSDSINWTAETKARAAVFDNTYFATVPWDTFTTNQWTLATDLQSNDSWLMSRPRAASVWNFRNDDGSEKLYFGDADSSVLWQLGGASSDLYFIPEWKSSWSDLGDAEQIKVIQRQRIEFDPGHYTDTIFIDWYRDLADTITYDFVLKRTPVWTDTIPVNTNENLFLTRYPSFNDYTGDIAEWIQARSAARGSDVRRQTLYRQVPRSVTGKFFSVGIRARGASADPLTVMKFGFEYQPLGKRRR